MKKVSNIYKPILRKNKFDLGGGCFKFWRWTKGVLQKLLTLVILLRTSYVH